jgi:hypothetical protein
MIFAAPTFTYVSRFASLLSVALLVGVVGSCSVAEPKASANAEAVAGNSAPAPAGASKAAEPKGATIEITPNGPADTVRVFYKHLREKKFRDAIFLTNLRPALEGLTDTELNEFSLDLEALAGQVPAEIKINGEIVSGDRATVTAMLPGDDDEEKLQSIKLRKQNEVWVILTVDESAEARIRKEGKQYFYNLRIETHEDEARKMLERVSKAQLAHSLQNGGLFTDVDTLVGAGLLPDDVKSSRSTGYNYAVDLSADKKRYTAYATPEAYGKSGKLSFLLQLDNKGISHVVSRDVGGKKLLK